MYIKKTPNCLSSNRTMWTSLPPDAKHSSTDARRASGRIVRRPGRVHLVHGRCGTKWRRWRHSSHPSFALRFASKVAFAPRRLAGRRGTQYQRRDGRLTHLSGHAHRPRSGILFGDATGQETPQKNLFYVIRRWGLIAVIVDICHKWHMSAVKQIEWKHQ